MALLSLTLSRAQSPMVNGGTPLDNNVLSIRDHLFGSHRLHYDDCLQYSPHLLALGLKSLGVQSASNWQDMLSSQAIGATTTALLVLPAKWGLGRTRPDGSRRNSFPSGHTATAFLGATWLDIEYGARYPWLSAIGYTAALAVAYGRVINRRHWPTDVMAGAVVGMGAAHLGYLLGDLIFPKTPSHTFFGKPAFLPCRTWSYELLSAYGQSRIHSGSIPQIRTEINMILPIDMGLPASLETYYILGFGVKATEEQEPPQNLYLSSGVEGRWMLPFSRWRPLYCGGTVLVTRQVMPFDSRPIHLMTRGFIELYTQPYRAIRLFVGATLYPSTYFPRENSLEVGISLHLHP